MKRTLIILFFIEVFLSVPVIDAYAVQIIFEYTGTIEWIQNEPQGVPQDTTFSQGDIFWGEYTFESEPLNFEKQSTGTAADETLNEETVYFGAISNFTFNTGSYNASANGSGFDIMTQNRASNKVSTYQVYASPYLSGSSWEYDPTFEITAPTFYGFDLQTMKLNLYINSFVLPDTSLPLTPPDLSLFDQGQLYLNYYHDGIDFGVSGYIDTLTLKTSPIPEPTTMLLLGSGLLTLAGFRRKFKKA